MCLGSGPWLDPGQYTLASSFDTDVLIVGAGPAGLALACALADAGWRSTVLEQAPLASLIDPPEDGQIGRAHV